MILIRDEVNGDSFDLRTLQRQLANYIEKNRKAIDNGISSPIIQTALLNEIANHQSHLQNLTEMQKLSFDVLIVIQKENEK